MVRGVGHVHCPYIKEIKIVKINKKNWFINKKPNCNTFNVIYAIVCRKENCQMACIGETKRTLKSCLADHCGYVRNLREDIATGSHFNSPGHSLSDLKIIGLKQSKKKKTYHINRFNTFYKGINR